MMKAKWVLALALAATVATPTLALVTLPGHKIVPAQTTWNLRPVVDGNHIAFGDYRFAGTTGSYITGYTNLFDVSTETLTVLGLESGTPVVSQIAWVAAWAPWTPQVGVEGDYVGYNTAVDQGGMVYQISTGTYMPVQNKGEQWHFADVSPAGLLAIQDWQPPFVSQVINPATWDANADGPTIYRTPVGNEFGQAPRIGGDIVVWNGQTNTTYDKYIYDISTNEKRLIWRSSRSNLVDTDGDTVKDKPAVAPVLIVDTDGTSVIMPVRIWTNRDADNQARTQIWVYDVASDEWTIALDQEGVDGEPMISGDWMVFQRRNVGGDFDVWAMQISTHTLVAIDTGLDTNAKYPTISGSLIAWAVEGINGDANQREIHYLYIPEPASLGLVALGGVMLAHRRRR